MIRVVVFLVLVGLLALGVAWFADRPGDVAITWLGYRIETSVMVALFAVALVVLAAIAAWSILRFLMRSPRNVSRFMRDRRVTKGHRAISRGLIAIGTGDAGTARRLSGEANKLLPHEPLALLLSAQSAQLSGEPGDAERAFRAMAERPDTKLLGLRGLYIEAQRRNDTRGARLYAEEAAKTEPGFNWASQAVLDFRCAANDWTGALERLEQMKSGLDRAVYRRQRAVLLTARAIALAENDLDVSRELALEAVKLAPSLVPAAALAGRQLAEAGERRKAAKILDAAWRAQPHPDLAEAYGQTRLGASARERLTRLQALASKTPGHIEAALAVARAALDAREFPAARSALEPFVGMPTQRVAELMADIEQEEHGDSGRARQWMARAVHAAPDPVWTADGAVSDRWLPVSPVSGKLDAFQWKVPVAEIGITRPVIEAEPATETQAETPILPTPEPVRRSKSKSGARIRSEKPRAAEPVIPLVHAPDDPGLAQMEIDDRLDRDPQPAPPPRTSDTWQRFKQLFR
jgi:HemY protein